MKFIHLVAATIVAFASANQANAEDTKIEETGCDIAIEDSDGAVSFAKSPDLKVLGPTKNVDVFRINEPEDLKVLALMCYRNEIVPTENDYKVVEAGYPLYISVTDAEGSERISVIDKAEGAFQVRMASGEMTKGENERARKLVGWLNSDN